MVHELVVEGMQICGAVLVMLHGLEAGEWGSRGILALMSPKRGPEPTITDLGEEQASNSIVVCSIVGMNIWFRVSLFCSWIPTYDPFLYELDVFYTKSIYGDLFEGKFKTDSGESLERISISKAEQ